MPRPILSMPQSWLLSKLWPGESAVKVHVSVCQSPMSHSPGPAPGRGQQRRAASRRAELELHLRRKNAELHQLQVALLSAPRSQRRKNRAEVDACEQEIKQLQGQLLLSRSSGEEGLTPQQEASGTPGHSGLAFDPEALASPPGGWGDTPDRFSEAGSGNNMSTTTPPLPVRGIWNTGGPFKGDTNPSQGRATVKPRPSLPLSSALGTPSVTPDRSPSLPLGLRDRSRSPAQDPPTAFQLGQWTLHEDGPGTPDLPSEFAAFEGFGTPPRQGEDANQPPQPLFLQPVSLSEPLSPAQRFKLQRGAGAGPGLPSFFGRR